MRKFLGIALGLLLATSAFATDRTVGSGKTYATVAAAMSAASNGDTITVYAGTYTEGINLSKSVQISTSGSVTFRPATFATGTAINLACSDCGFTGPATFQQFDGGAGADSGSGKPSRDRILLKNFKLLNCDNGLWIKGDNWEVDGIEIDGLRANLSPTAEDYGNIFGNNIHIKNCYFHGLQQSYLTDATYGYRHNDLFQFWNNNGETLKNVIIENNYFTNFVQGIFIANERGTSYASDVSNITIRNNVFWGSTWVASQNIGNWASHGIFLGKYGAMSGITISNNVFYQIANDISLYGQQTGPITITKNIHYKSGTTFYLSPDSPGTSSSILSGCTDLVWLPGYLAYNPAGLVKNVDPKPVNYLVPLGVDGVPFTTDDGWKPTTTAALTYGPQTAVGSPPTAVVATADTATVGADTTLNLIDVLANDTPAGLLSITSTTTPNNGGSVTLAGGILTQTAVPADGGTFTIGAKTYRYKNTIAQANDVYLPPTTYATATLSLVTAVPVDGETVTIGSKTYTWKDSVATTANEVLIGATMADSCNNLVAAIVGGSGSGSTYGSATVASTQVTAIRSSNTVVATAIASGTAPNAYATTETMTNGSFGGATMTGGYTTLLTDVITNTLAAINAGSGAGTKYYTGTTANASCTAIAGDTGEVVLVPKASITASSVATTETLTNGSFAKTTLTSPLGVLYSPAAAFGGTETFTYTATSRTGAVGQGLVTVTVTAANHAPVGVADAYTVPANSTGVLLAVLTNDTDADSDTLSIKSASVSSPNHSGTATISGTSILYTPAANYSGTETFTYIPTDGTDDGSATTVTITVSALPPPPPSTPGDWYSVRDTITGRKVWVYGVMQTAKPTFTPW